MPAIEKQLVDSSRMIADIVTARIGNNQGLYDEAVELMNRNEYPMSMRAARVVYFVFKKHQHLIRKHIPSFVRTLKNTKVDGVKRSILSILTETTIYMSEEVLGELVDTGFNFLNNPNQPVAVRAISIDLILKTTKTYPELKQELQTILESIYPHCSVGLKGRIKKTLKKI
jgi:hypothetical protein